MDYLTDLESTCAALGTNDGAGSYHKDDDCLECVKDLIRFLRRDDGNNHTLRQALGQIGVVKSDLLPILREYSSDDDLFDMVLRLVVNLTSPELLLFRQELPEDKLTRNYFLNLQRFRQGYKEACIDEKLWRVLAEKLGALLQKDFDERSEDDRLIIERILILVRNILEIPRDSSSEKRTEDDATVHDQILWVFHKSGMEDLLLYVASSSDEAQYCLHVLEIISLMFREQDPKFLASANFQRSKEERKEDEAALVRLRKEEEEKKKQKYFQIKSLRHSRFGGSYTLTNMKSISENPLIYHKPLSTLTNINFDENKRHKKISKNRETPKDECKRRSTLAIRLFLKEFCIEFLNGAYNQLMYVVKDNLNRQKAQQNDETYYLWAIKFFMEFNRVHKFRVELVTETMSKATFHYIHQQMEAYKDNYEHEKRNRPMCLTWARRMHLAMKAYQELLLNLISMSNSKDDEVKKSGMILRTDVFYEPEYRELCLQQLNMYNETKMSSNYLKDLIETTHAFMKLMESMSKSKHLVVKSKKKIRANPQKRTAKLSTELDGPVKRQDNEKLWDNISSRLSIALEENENLTCDISPFDSLSDASTEDQKLLAMIKIQDLLQTGNAIQSIAFLRAAREVWPEQDTFGAEGADNEDDFMTLREILFAEIPRPQSLKPLISETQNEPEDSNNIEPENELDEEYEEEYVSYSSEQQFDFKSLANRFAIKSVCQAYSLLFANYVKNSDYTNHCIIKMFHRISWDCSLPSMLFNISIFRTLQKAHKEYQTTKMLSLKEVDRFGKYLLTKFFETCKTNKKVYMELFFWKTTREASEILEGYGTFASNKTSKASFWTEDDEETLSRVYEQLKISKVENQNEDTDNDLLDSITAHFVGSGKSRRQVAKKLKAMNLIEDIKEVTRKPLKIKGRAWADEEVEILKTLYEKFKDAIDPVTRIKENLSNQRTKRKIIEKILELELCSNPGELKRKTNYRRQKRNNLDNKQSESEPDSAMDESSEEYCVSDNGTENKSSKVLLDILAHLPKNLKEALEWLKESFEENTNDKNDGDNDHFPLLAVNEPIISAIETDSFQRLLHFLNILSPSDSNVNYWSIQGKETIDSLKSKTAFLKDLIAKVESNVDLNIDDAENLLQLITKRRHNKWMPIRKNLDPAAQARINAENINVTEENPTVKHIKAKKARKRVSKKRKKVSKSDQNTSGSENAIEDSPKETDDIGISCIESSPNDSKNLSKKKRFKRTISSDSSSDDDISSKATIIETNDLFTTTDKLDIEDSSDDNKSVSTLKAKRRILDDSSSDEGVIDPYPGEEPRSFLPSSSPISRRSTITPSTMTPTSQTSISQTPNSIKRKRDSSSPTNQMKRYNY